MLIKDRDGTREHRVESLKVVLVIACCLKVLNPLSDLAQHFHDPWNRRRRVILCPICWIV